MQRRVAAVTRVAIRLESCSEQLRVERKTHRLLTKASTTEQETVMRAGEKYKAGSLKQTEGSMHRQEAGVPT
jgi:hypothetical protein